MDGNKRTALYLVDLLARRSGYSLDERDQAIVEMLVDVARGEMGYGELVDWFRQRLIRAT